MCFRSFIKLVILQGFVVLFLQARCSPYSFELRVKTNQVTRLFHHKKIIKVPGHAVVLKSKRKFRSKGVKFNDFMICNPTGVNETSYREILIAYSGVDSISFFYSIHPERAPPLA